MHLESAESLHASLASAQHGLAGVPAAANRTGASDGALIRRTGGRGRLCLPRPPANCPPAPPCISGRPRRRDFPTLANKSPPRPENLQNHIQLPPDALCPLPSPSRPRGWIPRSSASGVPRCWVPLHEKPCPPDSGVSWRSSCQPSKFPPPGPAAGSSVPRSAGRDSSRLLGFIRGDDTYYTIALETSNSR